MSQSERSAQTTRLEQDRYLAARMAQGDREAFDGFFREYFQRLFRFSLNRVNGDPRIAEEVAQRTMCIVVRKIGSFRGEALLYTWLCQIARNEIIAYAREHRVELAVDIGIEDHPAVQAALASSGIEEHRPESVQSRAEVAGFVRSTLDHLPSKYARVLEMKYISGHSVGEIAREIGVGEKAAESLLTRARVAFRTHFGSMWDLDILQD